MNSKLIQYSEIEAQMFPSFIVNYKIQNNLKKINGNKSFKNSKIDTTMMAKKSSLW